jgi:hypothetical protein
MRAIGKQIPVKLPVFGNVVGELVAEPAQRLAGPVIGQKIGIRALVLELVEGKPQLRHEAQAVVRRVARQFLHPQTHAL